jgi:formamidopyrimidine-DNA glycosylase
MPELPEVEVTRLSFADRIAGSRIESVSLGKPLRWPLGCDPELLRGLRIVQVLRRGKYLVMPLEGAGAQEAGEVGAATGQPVLLIHLGMSGSLLFAPALPLPGPHDHFSMVTTSGVLRLHDPRRFGAVVYADYEQDPRVTKLLGHLGMEPLSNAFDVNVFIPQMRARRAAIKQVLLAGEVVVGVGNIYACEVLFLAGIRPTTRADRVGPARLRRLHAAIRQVLAQAVQQGGSTLRDFSNADGQAGHFQLHALVYGREACPCKVCGTPLKRIQQGQRSTYFCPACQRG